MTALSSTEVAGLARLQQTMLAPHAHASVDGWMHAVNHDVKELFAADRGACILNLPDRPRVMMEVDLSQQAAYLEHYAQIDLAVPMLRELPHPYAMDASVTGAQLYKSYLGSEAFNDWYVPNEMTQSISIQAYDHMSTLDGIAPWWSSDLLALVLLGGSSMATGRKAATAETMLSLVQPVFQSAVRTLHQSMTPVPGGFGSAHVLAVLDASPTATWLFDSSGRCLHQSSAAAALVQSVAEGDTLFAGATQLARALGRGIRTRKPVAHAWVLQMGHERVGLVGSLLPDEGGAGPVVLVRAEGVSPRLPTPDQLQHRYGLTPREAEIALLRARGVGTAEVAEQLCISVHTARRHTENAMAKLGVHRAAEIGPVVMSLPGPR